MSLEQNSNSGNPYTLGPLAQNLDSEKPTYIGGPVTQPGILNNEAAVAFTPLTPYSPRVYDVGKMVKAYRVQQEKQKYEEDVKEAKNAVEKKRKESKAKLENDARTKAVAKGWSDSEYLEYKKKKEAEIDADCDKELKKSLKAVKKGENYRQWELEELDKKAAEEKEKEKEKDGEESKDGEKKDTAKEVAKATGEATGEAAGAPVPSLAAKSIGAFLGKHAFNVKDPMGRDAALREQANLHNVEAGEHRAAAQRENQIATRDSRREADKDGRAESASKNEQKVLNKGNASAGAAALEREEFYGDPNAHRNRADQSRQKGVENTEKAYDEDQVAIQERNSADVYNYKAKETEASNIETDVLSKGEDGGEDEEEKKKEEEEEKPHKTTTETVTETQKFEPQKAMNYMTYSLDPSSKQNPKNKTMDNYVGDVAYEQGKQYATTKMEGDDTWTDAVQAEATKGPITPDEMKKLGKNPNNYPGEGEMQTIMEQLRPNWYKWWQGVSARFKPDGTQINRGDIVDGKAAEPSEMGNTETTTTKTVTKDENGNIVEDPPSDYRVKDIVSAVAYDPRS